MNSVWEDGEKEAGEITLDFKKLKEKKSPTICRSLLTPSVMRLPESRGEQASAPAFLPGPGEEGQGLAGAEAEAPSAVGV